MWYGVVRFGCEVGGGFGGLFAGKPCSYRGCAWLDGLGGLGNAFAGRTRSHRGNALSVEFGASGDGLLVFQGRQPFGERAVHAVVGVAAEQQAFGGGVHMSDGDHLAGHLFGVAF